MIIGPIKNFLCSFVFQGTTSKWKYSSSSTINKYIFDNDRWTYHHFETVNLKSLGIIIEQMNLHLQKNPSLKMIFLNNNLCLWGAFYSTLKTVYRYMHSHISLSLYIIAQMFRLFGHKATLYFICENIIFTLVTQILHK